MSSSVNRVILSRGNLRVFSDGSIWASWVVSPRSYGYMSLGKKQSVRRAHQVFMRTLPPEAVLQSVMSFSSSLELSAAMMDGVDVNRYRQWVTECTAAAQWAEDNELGRRTYWLHVPLALELREQLLAPLRSYWNDVTTRVGFAPLPPSASLLAKIDRMMATIEQSAASCLAMRRASQAELQWLTRAEVSRGLVVGSPSHPGKENMSTWTVHPESIPLLDEHALSDVDKDKYMVNPMARRVVKVTCPETGDVTYQVPLVLKGVPSTQQAFPGATEIFLDLDSIGVDVDWTMRTVQTSTQKALGKVQRKLRNANDQAQQRDLSSDDDVLVSDLPEDILAAGSQLNALSGKLSANRHEKLHGVVIILVVSGGTLDEACDSANHVRRHFKEKDYLVTSPDGLIEKLWWQSRAGQPLGSVGNQFMQWAPSSDIDALVPYTDQRIGADTGMLLAENRSTSRRTPVMHPLDKFTSSNLDGSAVVLGEKGAGKSFTLMSMASAIVDRGGQSLIIDHTAEGEYGTWAHSVADAQVLEVVDPAYSMDPIQIFGSDGGHVFAKYIGQLVGLQARDVAGAALSQVTHKNYLQQHDLTSAAQVLDHLQSPDCEVTYAQELLDRLAAFAHHPLCAVILEPGLPAASLESPVIVWRTNGIKLPTEKDLQNVNMYREMSVEKYIGRAYYALLSGLFLAHASRNQHQFTGIFADEFAHWSTSPEALDNAETIVRESRRANAGLFIGAHGATDLRSDALAGLIRTRIALRQSDQRLAEMNVQYLGIDPGDSHYADLVRQIQTECSPADVNGKVAPERRGEGFMLDRARGCAAPIRIIGTLQRDRRAAADTTPGARIL